MDFVISADPPTPSPCPAPQRSPSYSHKLLAVVVSSDGAVTLQKVGKRAACGRTQPIIRQFHVHNVQSHFSPSSPPSPPSIGICASCLPLLAPASSYTTRRPVLRGLLSHSHAQRISSRVYTGHHTSLARTAQIDLPTPLLCGLPCPPHAVSCRCLLTYDL